MEKIIQARTHRAVALVAMVLLLSAGARAQGVKRTTATAPDGVSLSIQEYGDPGGAEVVLIHGLLGSHLNWARQVSDPALRRLRLITYDMRGHGLSGKPTGPASYSEGKRWGDDLQAVIAAVGLKRPTLVGWSLGGTVITNYLQTYGDSKIAGVMFVDGVIELKPELLEENAQALASLASPDLAVYLDGVRQFVRKCFFVQPDDSAFNLLYANAAMASPLMTAAVFGLSVPATQALPRVRVPVLLLQGDKDALVSRSMVEAARKLMPRAKVSIYAQTGHAPFFERPERFNSELSDFVRAASTPAP